MLNQHILNLNNTHQIPSQIVPWCIGYELSQHKVKFWLIGCGIHSRYNMARFPDYRGRYHKVKHDSVIWIYLSLVDFHSISLDMVMLLWHHGSYIWCSGVWGSRGPHVGPADPPGSGGPHGGPADSTGPPLLWWLSSSVSPYNNEFVWSY